MTKKICIFSPNLDYGGAEQVTRILLENISSEVFDVTLVVLNGGKHKRHHFLPKHVKVKNLECMTAKFGIWKFITYVSVIQPHIVFVNMSYLNVAVALCKVFMPRNIKLVVRETTNISRNNSTYKLSTLWNLGYRIAYRYVDLIICQSSYMRDELLNIYSVSSDKLVVINNPIPLDQIMNKSQKKNKITVSEQSPVLTITQEFGHRWHFVYVGRLSKEKKVDNLLRGLSEISSTDYFLDIFGGGEELVGLQELCVDLGINSNVRFHGFADNPYPAIKNADALLLFSEFEGFPNVLIEALALGTSVIASPAGGSVQELFENLKGCILAEGNAPKQITKAINDWVLLKNKSVVGFEPANYDAVTITQKYCNTFFDVLDETSLYCK